MSHHVFLDTRIVRGLPEMHPPGILAAMKVIMVKKRLKDGRECQKCEEATTFLRDKGVWDEIGEVLWFDASDPESPGVILANKYGMERAPFFVFEWAGRPAQAVDSVLRAYRML